LPLRTPPTASIFSPIPGLASLLTAAAQAAGAADFFIADTSLAQAEGQVFASSTAVGQATLLARISIAAGAPQALRIASFSGGSAATSAAKRSRAARRRTVRAIIPLLRGRIDETYVVVVFLLETKKNKNKKKKKKKNFLCTTVPQSRSRKLATSRTSGARRERQGAGGPQALCAC
jgi:hypothetical protein